MLHASSYIQCKRNSGDIFTFPECITLETTLWITFPNNFLQNWLTTYKRKHDKWCSVRSCKFSNINTRRRRKTICTQMCQTIVPWNNKCRFHAIPMHHGKNMIYHLRLASPVMKFETPGYPCTTCQPPIGESHPYLVIVCVAIWSTNCTIVLFRIWNRLFDVISGSNNPSLAHTLRDGWWNECDNRKGGMSEKCKNWLIKYWCCIMCVE